MELSGKDERCSVADLIFQKSSSRLNEVCLLEPGQHAYTFGELKDQVNSLNVSLSELACGNRIAVGLPEGVGAAIAILAVTIKRTAAPFNISLSKSELETSMDALRPDSVLVLKDYDGPLRDIARSKNINLLEINFDKTDSVDKITIRSEFSANPIGLGVGNTNSKSNDQLPILALLTSGTSAIPKVVPISQQNLFASCNNICVALKLSDSDRRLNIMPFYHVQGIVGGLFSPLFSGGSVVCTSSFDPNLFFGWMEEFQATWFSAVPTMFMSLLKKAIDRQKPINNSKLRFIRAGSFRLPEQIYDELRTLFNVPVIVSYGMTESTSQITCANWPPEIWKPGSVGQPAGPKVKIVDPEGMALKFGEIGEICAQGDNVMIGYETNLFESDEEVGRANFMGNWFRTGDLGYLDSESNLFITGRLKDMIKKGGESISPHEIEAALIDNPKIEEVAAFAIEHPRLGEDIAIAYVTKPGFDLGEKEIQMYLSPKLTSFKIPRRALHVDQLPKGSTGKIKRNILAETYKEILRSPVRVKMQPRNQTEQKLADIWQVVLGTELQSITDDFFDCGGHSLLAVEFLDQIANAFSVEVTMALLLPEATIENLAKSLSNVSQLQIHSSLVTLKQGCNAQPLFCIHAAGGGVLCYLPLARGLAEKQSVYAFRGAGLDTFEEVNRLESVEETAAHYLNQLIVIQPQGPYNLLGHSLGGLIAYEMAQQLRASGETVNYLGLVDTFCPQSAYEKFQNSIISDFVAVLEKNDLSEEVDEESENDLWSGLSKFATSGRRTKKGKVSIRAHKRIFSSVMKKFGFLPEGLDLDSKALRRYLRVLRSDYQMAKRYNPSPYDGGLTYFRAGMLPTNCDDPALGWSDLALKGVKVIPLQGNHFTVFASPALEVVTEQVGEKLSEFRHK